MNERTDATTARMDGRTDGRTVGRTDGRTGGRKVERMDGQTDGRTDRWTDGRSDRRTDGRTDGWTDERSDRRTDGRTVGRTANRARSSGGKLKTGNLSPQIISRRHLERRRSGGLPEQCRPSTTASARYPRPPARPPVLPSARSPSSPPHARSAFWTLPRVSTRRAAVIDGGGSAAVVYGPLSPTDQPTMPSGRPTETTDRRNDIAAVATDLFLPRPTDRPTGSTVVTSSIEIYYKIHL